jgi:hypothetical protein
MDGIAMGSRTRRRFAFETLNASKINLASSLIRAGTAALVPELPFSEASIKTRG